MAYPAPSTIPFFGTLQQWAINTFYAVGQRVVANGNVYQCTTGGESAAAGSGPSGTGGAIADNTVVWAYQSAVSAAWAALTVYAAGAVVTNDGGKLYTCIVGGTSAASGGPTGTGGVISDGTAPTAVAWAYTAAVTAASTAPTARTADVGAVPGSEFFAQYFNYEWALLVQWLLYARDFTANLFSTVHTWTAKQIFNGAGGDGEAATAVATVGVPSGASKWADLWTIAVAGHVVHFMMDGGGEFGIFVDCYWDAANSWFAYDLLPSPKTAAWALFFPLTGAGLWQFAKHGGADHWNLAAWTAGTEVTIAPGIATTFLNGVEALGGNVKADAGNVEAAGVVVGSAGPGLLKGKRLYGTGTALVQADFAFTGWGGAGLTTSIRGTDLAFEITITAGAVPVAAPVTQVTFKNGTFTTVPVCTVVLVNSTDPAAIGGTIQWVPTATTNIWTFNLVGIAVAPTAGQTYTFACTAIGV